MLLDPEKRGDLEKDANEILDKVRAFAVDHSSHLQDFNKFYRMYRCNPVKTRSENQSNTFIPEMFVEVEAIATAVFEMIFSDNTDALFFDVVGQDGSLGDTVKAMVTKSALSKQIELIDFQAKLLPYFRMLPLLGSYPADIPWRLDYRMYWDDIYRVSRPAFDCWDFEPFSVVNFAFDDTQPTLEMSEWGARTRHVTRKAAELMVRRGIWRADIVAETANEGMSRNTYDQELRTLAGYQDYGHKTGFSVHEYFGTLESREDTETYWAVVTSSGKFLKAPEINPYAHGEKPWLMGQWFSLPEEPYGMGIGHINYRTQSEINDRRNFINDMLYSSLYSMWLKRSDSGLLIPGGKMRYSPHQIIEGDGISEEFLRALRPDMAGLPAAVNLEASDIEKMRRHSGATSTLQAVATGITATESQQISSESTRRLRAQVRANVASFLRKMLYRAHALNLQFMDNPVVAQAVASDGLQVFGHVTRQDLIINPDIRMKLPTDLDFRPAKRRELIELLDIFGRLQGTGMLGARKIVPDPIIEELAATYGMDPRKFFGREGLLEMETQRQMQNPATQAQAMQELVAQSPGAQQVLAGAA